MPALGRQPREPAAGLEVVDMASTVGAVWLGCQIQITPKVWGQVDLHIDMTAAPTRSLRARLEHTLREATRSGRLAANERLPSSRELAVALGVSRGVVVDAYAQLAAEGYLRTARGGGTRVARTVAPTYQPTSAPTFPVRIRYDPSPFRPALGEIPRRMLSAALARVLRDTPNERLGVLDPAGTLELRTTLSFYLGRVRGVQAAAEQLVITSGHCRHGLPAEADRTRGATPRAAPSPSGYLHGWRFHMGVIRGLARSVGSLLLGLGGLLRGVLGGVGGPLRRLV